MLNQPTSTTRFSLQDEQQQQEQSSSSFCLAMLLQSKSINPTQVCLVSDNAKRPSDTLRSSISSNMSLVQDELEEEDLEQEPQEQQQQSVVVDDLHHRQDVKKEDSDNSTQRRKTTMTKTMAVVHHPSSSSSSSYCLPNIPFDTIIPSVGCYKNNNRSINCISCCNPMSCEGNLENENENESNEDDDDMDEVLEIIDRSLDIVDEQLPPSFFMMRQTQDFLASSKCLLL